MNESLISHFLHTRSATVVMSLLAVAGALAALATGRVTDFCGDGGFVMSSPDGWFTGAVASFSVNVAVVVSIAVLSIVINKQFNTMRSLSSLFAGLFMIMVAATPSQLARFNSGSLLAVVFVGAAMLLFSAYQNFSSQRRVFSAFFFLSAGTLCQYAFLLYVPVFLIGMAQMKIFNVRNVMAAVLGLVTPLWILMGFGIITPDDFYLPDISLAWKHYADPAVLTVFVTAVLTAFVGIMFFMMNMIKILSYNSRIRAVNGFMAIAMIATVIFTLFDFNNIATYMPLLSWLAAYQAGHFFATNTNARSYIGVFVLLAVYLGIYGWNMSV